MYETSATLASALWPVASSGESDRPREPAADDSLTGFPPPAQPDAAWVPVGSQSAGVSSPAASGSTTVIGGASGHA